MRRRYISEVGFERFIRDGLRFCRSGVCSGGLISVLGIVFRYGVLGGVGGVCIFVKINLVWR